MAVFTETREDKHGEIVHYQMGRYINTNEASWRILRFPLHDRDPAIVFFICPLKKWTMRVFY